LIEELEQTLYQKDWGKGEKGGWENHAQGSKARTVWGISRTTAKVSDWVLSRPYRGWRVKKRDWSRQGESTLKYTRNIYQRHSRTGKSQKPRQLQQGEMGSRKKRELDLVRPEQDCNHFGGGGTKNDKKELGQGRHNGRRRSTCKILRKVREENLSGREP